MKDANRRSAPPGSDWDSSHRERRKLTEASGLHVEIEPLAWPPQTVNRERLEIHRYLRQYYEVRRRQIDASRSARLMELERADKAQKQVRKYWVSGIVSAVLAFLSINALSLRYWLSYDFVNVLAMFYALHPVLFIVAVALFVMAIRGQAPQQPVHFDEEHPSATDLEAIYDKRFSSELNALWASAQPLIAADKAGPQENALGPYLSFPDKGKIGDAEFLARIGLDGRPRFSPRTLYYLSFHRDQVIAYEGAVDLIKGQPIYHSVREFSYQDIASISRARRPVTFLKIEAGEDDDTQERSLVTTQELFQLDLINGSSVSFMLRDQFLEGAGNSQDLPQSETDQIVELIRALVRDKKRYALDGRQTAHANGAASAAFPSGV